MYEELASVRGIVDLSPRDALDSAESFLGEQGYTIVRRGDDSLTAERRSSELATELSLTVAVLSQPGGGVRITVTGNDLEGVQERQAAWIEWSESLPKKPEAPIGEPQEQPTIETPDVPLPPPPATESSEVPPPPPTTNYPSFAPSPGQGTGRRTALILGGCAVLVLLLLIGLVGGFFLLSGSGSETASPETAQQDEETKEEPEPTKAQKTGKGSGKGKQKQKAEQSAVRIGEDLQVGDVRWRVIDAGGTNELEQTEFGQFGETKQGNFVIVDFEFTNLSNEPTTLDRVSIALLDGAGRESQPDSDTFGYIPNDLDPFLEQVNPGVTEVGRVIFTVAPDASNFRLQLGDAEILRDENGYVDLGF